MRWPTERFWWIWFTVWQIIGIAYSLYLSAKNRYAEAAYVIGLVLYLRLARDK